MDRDLLILIGGLLKAPIPTLLLLLTILVVMLLLFAVEDPRLSIPLAALGGGPFVFMAIKRYERLGQGRGTAAENRGDRA